MTSSSAPRVCERRELNYTEDGMSLDTMDKSRLSASRRRSLITNAGPDTETGGNLHGART
jgi:hypothetical protein